MLSLTFQTFTDRKKMIVDYLQLARKRQENEIRSCRVSTRTSVFAVQVQMQTELSTDLRIRDPQSQRLNDRFENERRHSKPERSTSSKLSGVLRYDRKRSRRNQTFASSSSAQESSASKGFDSQRHVDRGLRVRFFVTRVQSRNSSWDFALVLGTPKSTFAKMKPKSVARNILKTRSLPSTTLWCLRTNRQLNV
ncbi:hypothetical protein M3Y94_00676900 [Aphelenchoides besseyi]|nr:hypothetical protein M3Y94_00676900 [Aphelenchoides besseyi]